MAPTFSAEMQAVSCAPWRWRPEDGFLSMGGLSTRPAVSGCSVSRYEHLGQSQFPRGPDDGSQKILGIGASHLDLPASMPPEMCPPSHWHDDISVATW